MKRKFMMLTLCFSLVLAISSCKNINVKHSGAMQLNTSDTSLEFYHTYDSGKNNKQKIILAYWYNFPISGNFKGGGELGSDSTNITCSLTKSNPTINLQCIGTFNRKTGKGTVNINGKNFDVSNGRLFLINTHEKPIKVIQVNEQFNAPPFDDLPSLDSFSRSNPFPTDEQRFKLFAKFEYLAKHNKTVAAFLADSKKNFDLSQNQSKNLKKNGQASPEQSVKNQ